MTEVVIHVPRKGLASLDIEGLRVVHALNPQARMDVHDELEQRQSVFQGMSGITQLDASELGNVWSYSADPVDRMMDEIQGARQLQECPIQLLDECVVSLSPPAFYDDIQKGEVVGFRLPSVKDLEVTMRGYRVHVLGVSSSPIEA